jgi:tRNA threonylcarbamoyl adenosine modification protein YeaZ
MLILAFECSNSQLAVAILRENKLLSQEIIEDGFSHSELLVVKINDILQKNNLHFDDLDLVVVGNGPSSFTALRVALTVAKIINISCLKPVVTVNKCESLAFYFKSNSKLFEIDKKELQLTTIIYTANQEIFIARYGLKNDQLNSEENPRISSVDEILYEAQKTTNFLLFDQNVLYQKFINNFPKKTFLINNDPFHLGLLGFEKYRKFGESKEISPIYLIEPKISQRKS